MAYNENTDKGTLQRFWSTYFLLEKEIYEKLLTEPDAAVSGTVKELAEKYGTDVFNMTGFLDGINDSLKNPNPIEEMEEDTVVNLDFDKAFHSGIIFLQQKNVENYTESRRLPVLL